MKGWTTIALLTTLAAGGRDMNSSMPGGRALSERVDFPRGHAQNPLSDAEVDSKFLALAEPRLGRERADAVLRWLWRLDEVQSLDSLMKSMKLSD